MGPNGGPSPHADVMCGRAAFGLREPIATLWASMTDSELLIVRWRFTTLGGNILEAPPGQRVQSMRRPSVGVGVLEEQGRLYDDLHQ